MSTATLKRRQTVLDPNIRPITRLGADSNGMRMTKQEFRAVKDWDEHFRYELIHGVVIVAPPAAEGERGPNGELDYLLRLYRDTHPQGFAFDDSLFEQEIDTGDCIRRADRVIWAGLGRRPHPKQDVPAIVVEFVSPGTNARRRDYEEKRREYAAIGVKEYWIIDRFRRTLTDCRGRRKPLVVQEKETYTTDLLPGFELPLAKLLAAADRWA
jgi:Uma2 family endonuclease